MFELKTEILVPHPLDDVFAFFSDAGNLEKLTPSFLHFEILTAKPIVMEVGTLIDYRLRIRGIPLKWRSEITVWEPPYRFVDEQRRGPYKLWIHEHRFEKRDGGTLVRDGVRYDHLGGGLVNRWLIKPDLERIFEFRHEVLREIFP